MFGNPTIIVTMPETCRRVLMDDERFKQGWPKSTCDLMGKKSFLGISDEEHKRLRRLTAAPINGHKALSAYHEHIRDIVVNSLDKWTKEERPIEFLTEIKKITFKIIMYIFLGSEIDPMMKTLEKEYAILNNGLRAMAINLPGFAYHEALKVISYTKVSFIQFFFFFKIFSLKLSKFLDTCCWRLFEIATSCGVGRGYILNTQAYSLYFFRQSEASK